jgi:hypothetical protein
MASITHSAKSRFALVFGDGAVSVALEAPDRASAFETAQRLVREDRPAKLLEDGVVLAQIEYSPAGFWTISEQPSRVA